MRYQYYYYVEAPENLLTFLAENRVKRKVDETGVKKNTKYVVFSIYSSQPNYQELLDTLTTVYGCKKPLVFCDYSKKELQEAEFLWVTPYRHCLAVRNDEEAFQFSCNYTCPGLPQERSHHRKQIAPIQICKEPKLSQKTAFYTLETGFCFLFADYRIKALAEQHDLRGLLFQPVYLRNGVESRKIFQISSSHILTIDAVARGHGEKSEFCPFLCGKESLLIDASYQMHLLRSHIEPTLDLMCSEDFWGEGLGFSAWIISQKFYRLLLAEKFTGSLSIAPIVLE